MLHLHAVQLDKAVYSSIQTAFSAQTNANQVQDIIDLKLDKRRKGVYGPPHNMKAGGVFGEARGVLPNLGKGKTCAAVMGGWDLTLHASFELKLVCYAGRTRMYRARWCLPCALSASSAHGSALGTRMPI